MSIQFSGPLATFIELTFIHLDPTDRSKQIFTYPSGTNFSAYTMIYTYINYQIVYIIPSTFTLMPNSNKLKLKLSNFNLGIGSKIKLLCSTTTNCGIDFVDKFNQVGTVYAYDSFTVTNVSKYNRQFNTTIISEDLIIGFLKQYPLTFYNVKYTNGIPSISLNLNNDLPGSINQANFFAYFNSIYAGSINTSGSISGSFNTAKAGKLEVVYRGILEFSTSINGPWSNSLFIPVINVGESKTYYIRCGQSVSSLVRLLNSVKVITTEAI